jgi:hypothetical protein
MFCHRQRVARVRRLAVRALDAYPLVDPQLRFIADEENTTFRVDATPPDERGRFLLRVHRPACLPRIAAFGAPTSVLGRSPLPRANS